MDERDARWGYASDPTGEADRTIDAEDVVAYADDSQPTAEPRRADYPLEHDALPVGDERTIELREEQLVVHRDLRDLGEVVISTEVEEVPGRVEVDSAREEVEIEHVPVGRFVSERVAPWEDGDALIVPIYEEQVVVTKRLLLREQLRVRRISTTQHQVFEDTLRRDRLVVDAPEDTEAVHERYSAGPSQRHVARGRADVRPPEAEDAAADEPDEGGLLSNLVRRALQ